MSEEILALPGQSGIAKAEEIHQKLDGMLLCAEPIVLDAGKVERVDTAVLQMLYSFVTSARAAGVRVSWGEVSTEFRAGARQLGLDKVLALP